MAELLTVRNKNGGCKLLVEHLGVEYRLFRPNFTWPENPTAQDIAELKDWATPHVLRVKADLDAKAALKASASDAIENPAAFKQWILANWTRSDVKEHLKPLALMFSEETA